MDSLPTCSGSWWGHLLIDGVVVGAQGLRRRWRERRVPIADFRQQGATLARQLKLDHRVDALHYQGEIASLRVTLALPVAGEHAPCWQLEAHTPGGRSLRQPFALDEDPATLLAWVESIAATQRGAYR